MKAFTIAAIPLLLCMTSNAQVNNTFLWGFNDEVSTSLSECSNMSIKIISSNVSNPSFGTPPYYFAAFEVGGAPTINLAGSNRSSLSWQVNHQVGSRLMLSMFDAEGSPGGVPPQLFTVIPGGSTSCLPPAPNPNFNVTSNVTDIISTCDPWGLTIRGGTKPYNVTLLALNRPSVTNVTLGPEDNELVFIDRVPPDTQVLAAVSDATGQFATGTPILQTTGSSDVTCTGLETTSGNATIISQQEVSAAAVARKRHQTTTVVSVTLLLAAFILLGGVTLMFFRNHQSRNHGIINGQDTKPRTFQELGSNAPSIISGDPIPSLSEPVRFQIRNTLPPLPPTPPVPSAPLVTIPTPEPRHNSNCPSDCDCQDCPTRSTHYPSRFPTIRSPNAAAGPSRVTTKEMEARELRNGNISRSVTLPAEMNLPSPRQAPKRSASTPFHPARPNSTLRRGTTEGRPNFNVVIQHSDGGVIPELPPPYADRRRQA